MRKFIMLVVITTIITLVSPAAFAGGKGGSRGYRSYKGAKAIDGDTFRYKGERYRIQQYNAPEIGQPDSRKATRNLQRKIDSGDYKWKPVTKDIYKRTIVNEQHK